MKQAAKVLPYHLCDSENLSKSSYTHQCCDIYIIFVPLAMCLLGCLTRGIGDSEYPLTVQGWA